MCNSRMSKTVHIFIDESGNYDFSNSGTEHLCYTAISTLNPVAGIEKAEHLRHYINSFPEQFACDGIEYFHCTEDKQPVRNEFFRMISIL